MEYFKARHERFPHLFFEYIKGQYKGQYYVFDSDQNLQGRGDTVLKAVADLSQVAEQRRRAIKEFEVEGYVLRW